MLWFFGEYGGLEKSMILVILFLAIQQSTQQSADSPCTQSGNNPAPSCYQYYDCVFVMWWYENTLESCPDGQAFDTSLLDCAPAVTVNCQSRTTTTTTTTTVAPPSSSSTSSSSSSSAPATSSSSSSSAPATSSSSSSSAPSSSSSSSSSSPSSSSSSPGLCTGPGNLPAASCYQYYQCVQVWGSWQAQLQTCQEDFAFDVIQSTCRAIAFVNCQNRQTTAKPKPTKPSTVVPKCSGPGRHPAPSCYQYHECVQVWWGWEAHLLTCTEGLAFDAFVSKCRPLRLVDCHQRATTISVVPTRPPHPPPEVPKCSGPSKHPAALCHQYYECVQNWWWWEPKLKSCKKGEEFDVFRRGCGPSEYVKCWWRTTTQKPTPPRPLIPVPSCSGAGRHPAPICYQYYECVQEWWWWKPQLRTCSPGHCYNTVLKDCYPSRLVDCQHRLTTTVRPTHPRPLPPREPPEVPKCNNRPSKHPAASCSQYYECVQSWWWWQPELKTCANGQAFDVYQRTCVSTDSVNCHWHPITKPPRPPPPTQEPQCYTDNRHPAPICYQYYQCVQDWWGWKAELRTCPPGTSFDYLLDVCYPHRLVDCHHRITTPTAVASTSAPRPPPQVPQCSKADKHPAPQCHQYYQCVQNWWWWEAQLETCPTGQSYDVSRQKCAPSGLVNCRWRTTTTVPTKPTPRPPPIQEPSCSGSAKHPAPSCYEYYECEQVGWWWEAHLKTCAPGKAFDAVLNVCYPSRLVNCQHRTSTTVRPPTVRPRPPPEAPKCTTSGKHPARICTQYYECVQNWWWWEPEIKWCPEGQAFDSTKGRCSSSGLKDCPWYTPTQKPPPSIPEPSCKGPSKHPAPICYQYYECVQNAWWWQPQLKTCPPGLSYDVTSRDCYPSRVVHCRDRVTTPRPNPVGPTRPRPPPGVPQCDGYSKHPASKCYQYYECVQNWWAWQPQLRTCPDGEAYHPGKQRCVCAEVVRCKLPARVPTCTGSGKYKASKCNEYYECVQSWWWWTPQLKKCPDGQGFASSIERCAYRGHDCRKGSSEDSSNEDSANDSNGGSSGENSSKENGSGENSSKENGSAEKENGSKEADD